MRCLARQEMPFGGAGCSAPAFVITIDQATAPHSSLAFMFWGEGLFVFPLMLL
jgi:hypothetical protein